MLEGKFMNYIFSIPIIFNFICMKKTFSSSTFGVVGNKWHLAAKATCNTMSSSFAGGTVATLMSYILIDGKFEVPITINGILGSLVAISAGMRSCWIFLLCLINPILKIY